MQIVAVVVGDDSKSTKVNSRSTKRFNTDNVQNLDCIHIPKHLNWVDHRKPTCNAQSSTQRQSNIKPHQCNELRTANCEECFDFWALFTNHQQIKWCERPTSLNNIRLSKSVELSLTWFSKNERWGDGEESPAAYQYCRRYCCCCFVAMDRTKGNWVKGDPQNKVAKISTTFLLTGTPY
jgi:hypothetical protein